jgi:chemotaxis protein MotD
MSAADSLAVRVAAAASRTARAGADSHAETKGEGCGASGFLDVLADRAAPQREVSQEPAAPAGAAAAAGLLQAALRQLACAAEAAAGAGEVVRDRQAPAVNEGPLIPPPPSLAEVAAVLGAALPRQSPVPAAAGLGTADATVLVRPQADRAGRMPETRQDQTLEPVATSAALPAAVAAAGLRVVERATHLAPATGAGAGLPELTTPTVPPQTAAGLPAPTPATDEEASPAPADLLPAEGTQAKAAKRPFARLAGDAAASRAPSALRQQQAERPEPSPAAAIDADAEGKSSASAVAQPPPAVAAAPAHGVGVGLESGPALGPASPLRQLAQHIAAEAAPGEAATGGAVAHDKTPAPSVLRVLSIQLQPLELGTVSVRMRMRNDAIAVEITADRQETARLLQQDREALLRLLQASGLATDSIQVLSRPVEPAPSGVAHGWPQFSQQQAGAGFAQADARSFGKQGQAGREHKTLNPSRKGDDEISSAGAGGSLYV